MRKLDEHVLNPFSDVDYGVAHVAREVSAGYFHVHLGLYGPGDMHRYLTRLFLLGYFSKAPRPVRPAGVPRG